jgi:hypothetical protein
VSAISEPRTGKRFGSRLLGFLGLGLVALALSTAQGGYTLLSLTLVVVALAGGVWNTACGLARVIAVPPNRRARGRSVDGDG